MAYAFGRHKEREHVTVLRFFVDRPLRVGGVMCGLAAITVSFLASLETARADDRTTPVATVPDGFRCRLKGIENAKQAAAAISTAFHSVWLHSGDGWIAKYALADAQGNPLRPDLNENDKTAKPITGYAYVTGLSCAQPKTTSKTSRKRDSAAPLVIGVVAATLRFNEGGAGWTGSIDDSAIAAAALERHGETWTARLIRHDDLAVPPDARWQKAAVKDAPPHSIWPSKPCEPPQLWSGSVCR